MINENKIKENLLSQAEPEENKNKKSIQELIARDSKRVKLLKTITIMSWIIAALLPVLLLIIEKTYGQKHSPKTEFEAVGQFFFPAMILIFRGVLLISIFLTVSLYVRSKNLTIKQINLRLANIEEQLKNLIQSK